MTSANLPQVDTFEERTTAKARELLAQLFVETPELRSAVVVFDWKGPLNKACRPFVLSNSLGRTLQATDDDILLGLIGQAKTLTEELVGAIDQVIGAKRHQLLMLAQAEHAQATQSQEPETAGTAPASPDAAGGVPGP